MKNATKLILIKHTNMASAARLQIIGRGVPIINNRQRRLQILTTAAKRPAQ